MRSCRSARVPIEVVHDPEMGDKLEPSLDVDIEADNVNGGGHTNAEEEADGGDLTHDSLPHLVGPDGGWGWLVVLGSFCCLVLVDGISCSFGLLLRPTCPFSISNFKGGNGGASGDSAEGSLRAHPPFPQSPSDPKGSLSMSDDISGLLQLSDMNLIDMHGGEGIALLLRRARSSLLINNATSADSSEKLVAERIIRGTITEDRQANVNTGFLVDPTYSCVPITEAGDSMMEHRRAILLMPGSLLMGSCLFLGPLASALSNQFDFRPVVMAGAIISTAALLASAYTTSIQLLVVSFGLFGGMFILNLLKLFFCV
ncbi:unnamed protein product [Protopolystoma xenopodis]|uniref:Major facilitator superfamily (MFS) profile domain-containing protein n=1 Tax=Protopolystoma xenopodis TaxID=117903 RepID=A0A3S5B675_9PLAT|nr:unnamed protein product [Protopolystoma xenopodis]